MAGMDKAEALAFVRRMFDAASAGAAIWGDPLLVKGFLSQCSRTGSEETIRGYRREIRDFMRWRDLHHPYLLLREMTAPFCQDFVDELRREVEAERLKPRIFNRRIAAVSSMYRWASEPSRSQVTGVPRNLIPSRSLLHAEKTSRGLSEEQVGLLLAAVCRSMRSDPRASLDHVLVKGSYRLGCRVGELARLKWKSVERLGDGGQILLFGKRSKSRVVRVSSSTLALFEPLGRGETDGFVFPSSRRKNHLTRQAISDVFRTWGKRSGFHVYSHQLRHSHATYSVQRGCDVFTLQATLGHSSSATTGHYVASNTRDSSSLRLGQPWTCSN